jgi:hypothetical protein
MDLRSAGGTVARNHGGNSRRDDRDGRTDIVPALLYFFNLDQHSVPATSLAILLPPAGRFAFIQY